MQRAEVVFRGRVQGVGFRYRTLQVAEAFDVAGYVRNLPNGTVEMVAEGEREQVDAFLTAVLERMGGYVTDHDSRWPDATGEYTGFGVRY